MKVLSLQERESKEKARVNRSASNEEVNKSPVKSDRRHRGRRHNDIGDLCEYHDLRLVYSSTATESWLKISNRCLVRCAETLK